MRDANENYRTAYLMCVLYAFVVIVLQRFSYFSFFCSFAHVGKVERKLSTNSLTGGAFDFRRRCGRSAYSVGA